jgi:hypothetical protein
MLTPTTITPDMGRVRLSCFGICGAVSGELEGCSDSVVCRRWGYMAQFLSAVPESDVAR